MKYIYFGTSVFSRVVLTTLCNKGAVPSLVVSQPDRARGRGLKMQATKVSAFAEESGIALIKPESLKSQEVIDRLSCEGAELFLIADYGKILPRTVLDLPEQMCLCVHPSLLPRYRGPAPVSWSLIHGDIVTGVTIFKVNESIDAGEMILQKEIPIAAGDDVCSLSETLAQQGAELLIKALKLIRKNKHTLTPQDKARATYNPKLTKEHGRIDWKMSARHLHNIVRATLSWPSAYTWHKDTMIKVLGTEVIDESADCPPSVIARIDNNGIYVATQAGILCITRVKPQGKQEMTAFSFACGRRLNPGDRFSSCASDHENRD